MKKIFCAALVVLAICVVATSASALTYNQARGVAYAHIKSRCGNSIFRCNGFVLSRVYATGYNQVGKAQYGFWGFVTEVARYWWIRPRNRACQISAGMSPFGYITDTFKECEATTQTLVGRE